MKIVKLIMIINLMIVISSCKADTINDSFDGVDLQEYQEKFTEGMISDDEAIIKKTINYIDSIIMNKNQSIRSLHYNKALLQYKLNNIDDAIATIIQSPLNNSDYYTATLMLTSDKYANIGKIILRDIKKRNEFYLKNSTLEKAEIMSIINYLENLRILLDEEEINYSELFQNFELDTSDLIELKKNNSLSKEGILKSLW